MTSTSRFARFKPVNRLAVSLLLLVVAVFTSLPAGSVQAQPTFSKVFSPDTIGPGSATTLTFTISNGSGSPVTAMAFTDVLPAGVTIASPANALDTCSGGTLSAPAGGGSITYSGGALAGSSNCTVSVDVTSSTIGTHTNTTGDLTSSAGNSGTATDDLNVVSARPGFSKAFSPSSVVLGGRSTLTFTIDNSANVSRIGSLDFTDNLPTGIEVASPANASTDCVSASAPDTTITATPGSSTIVLDANGSTFFPGFEVLPAGGTCTVAVDVVGTGLGTHSNTVQLLADFVLVGSANAALTVTSGGTLQLTKAFSDDPVSPGGTVTLEFTLQNNNRNFSASGLSFTDDLDATLSGLAATGLPASACGGTLSGTSLITLTGGTLPASGSCTFSVALQVPGGAAAGSYPNTTSAVSGTIDGSPAAGLAASDTLFVVDGIPLLTKSFTDDPVVAGGSVTLEFSITNSSSTQALTDIAFTDELTTFLPFPLSVSLPPTPDPPCGAGSSLGFVFPDIDRQALSLTGGNLAASGSCTFSVTVDIPAGMAAGSYLNTTSQITATAGGVSAVTGPAASDTLTVSGGALRFSKTFTDDPAVAGGTATLEFTIENPATNPTATAITFTDDLSAALAGMTGSFPSTPDPPCGAGSAFTGSAGDTLLTLTGGTLASGASCTFSVITNVPGGAAAGSYTNTTSILTATVAGGTVTTPAATDSLLVGGITFTKEFIDDPVVAGGTVTLRFTIDNSDGSDATGMFFTDNLAANLAGLAAVGPLPANPCGAGSSLSGTTFLILAGGNLTAGTSCSFDVTVQVPGGAASNSYANVTSNLTATLGGNAVVFPPASDTLVVQTTQLELTKSFTDDPVAPGGSVTLEFVLTNLDAGQAASAIAFTDDLGAALAGLTFDSLLFNDCGVTISGTGTTLIGVSGGALAAGASCTIRASLTVPGGAASSTYTNTTSSVTGTIGGLSVTGEPATDDLVVTAGLQQFSKSFDGPTTATGTAVLTFTITNPGASASSNLTFTDDLDAVISGLVATNLPLSDVCGAGSQISGTSFLTFSGGSLAASGGTCSFDVDVLVPASATAGTFPNTTSDLFAGGLKVADPATASLTIEPPPTFAKVFFTDTILFGGVSTLTFTVDNSASALAATALDFTDNLPAGVSVATPAVTANTCGGTLIAAAGAGVISFSGGSVGAGASCTIDVDVTSSTTGAHVNTTGDLTSSSGNSGTATDTLTVLAQPPVFSKDFAPNPASVGVASTLTFTIDNSATAVNATGLGFTDNFPAGLLVATPANASTTCTGGTLTAVSGSGSVSYASGTVTAGAICTIDVDVVAAVAGSYVNTTGDLLSELGNSGTATDTLNVTDGAPVFSKAFSPAAVLTGGISVLTFTIDNSAATTGVRNLAFSDVMPSELVIATTPNLANSCSGGVTTAAAGTSTISYIDGSLLAGATCTISVDVVGTTPGSHVNTSGDLTSSLGNSGPASATLVVTDPAPLFSKVFTPDSIPAGEISTLVFTIDNSGAAADATSLTFIDVMPAAVTVAASPNASTTCTGGTIDATSGTNTISYTGGAVSGGASCTVSVDVTSTVIGSHFNETDNLISSLGNSGTATDTLTVTDPIADVSVTLADDIDPIVSGNNLTYTATVSNAGPQDATNTVATVTLPAGVTLLSTSGCAEDPNGVPTCTLGTISAGGSSVFTMLVQVDIGTSGTITNTVSATSDVTDSDPSNNSASENTTVTQAQGTITIVKNTAPAAAGNGTFTFSSADSDFDGLSLTTVGNVATSAPIIKTAGSYVVSEDEQRDWRLDSIECTGDVDGGSVVDLDNNAVTIDMDDGEAIVCTFTNVRDESAVIEDTQDLIAEFMDYRADQITSSSPDLVERLRERNKPHNTAGDLDGSLEKTNDSLTSNFQFSTSLHRVQSWRQSLVGGVRQQPNKYDIWMEAHFSQSQSNGSDKQFGLIYLGADYLINPDLVVGGIIQFDWASLERPDTKSATGIAEVSGHGWMAGPYFVYRPMQNLYVDGRVAWGQSYNEVNPYGTFADDFDTDRWLASLRITGDYMYDNLRISPAAEFIYFHETQKAFVNAIGITIPGQDLDLGRLIFGPEFSYDINLEDGSVLTPTLKFEGIWDFHKSGSATSSRFTTTDKIRARINLGLGYTTPYGIALQAEGFYDGIGASGYDSYGGKFKVKVPLN